MPNAERIFQNSLSFAESLMPNFDTAGLLGIFAPFAGRAAVGRASGGESPTLFRVLKAERA